MIHEYGLFNRAAAWDGDEGHLTFTKFNVIEKPSGSPSFSFHTEH